MANFRHRVEINMPVRLAELVDAFEWAGATGPFQNSAYVSRATGQIWLVSDLDDAGEAPPEDVDDDASYLAVPREAELDLRRSLALQFVAQGLPEHHERTTAIFRASGAQARFERWLDEAGHLEAWHAFEAKGIENALRDWARRNGVEVDDRPAAAV
jgi:hypothetical protein